LRVSFVSIGLFVLIYFVGTRSCVEILKRFRVRGRSETIGWKGQRIHLSHFMLAACDKTELCDIFSCQKKWKHLQLLVIFEFPLDISSGSITLNVNFMKLCREADQILCLSLAKFIMDKQYRLLSFAKTVQRLSELHNQILLLLICDVAFPSQHFNGKLKEVKDVLIAGSFWNHGVFVPQV